MNCFLIDFENVRSSGLRGIEHLTNADDVCIFYSDYANSITFDMHYSMNKSSANITFFRSTRTGKNSLDFQLITYLGYLIAQKKYKNYYVITGDRWFESAIAFWKDFFKENGMNYISIGRFYTITDAITKKNVPTKTIKDSLPTIPTVESELELRQLKAERVIVEVPTSGIKKTMEKSLSVDDSRPSKEDKPTSANTSAVESKIKTVNDREDVGNTRQMENITTKPSDGANATKRDTTRNSSNGNTQNYKSQGATSKDNKKPQTQGGYKQPYSKEDNKFNRNKNGNVNNNNSNTNTNNKNTKPNQNQNSNANGKPNNTPQQSVKKPTNGANNNPQNRNKPQNNVPKLGYVEQAKLPSQATKPNDNNSTLFGKIDLNSDGVVVENIEKKAPQNKTIAKPEPTKKITPPNLEDLVENVKPKQDAPKKETTKPAKNVKKSKEETPKQKKSKAEVKTETSKVEAKTETPKVEVKAETPKVEAKTETPKVEVKTETPKVEVKAETPKVEVKTETPKVEAKAETPKVEKSTPKRGRPRTKSIEETLQTEKSKPKNDKKFQNEIPAEKLPSMLEILAKLPALAECSSQDLTIVCKVVAFGTKNEAYRACMSLLGKKKALVVYPVVKQQFDTLKKVYEG